MASALQSQLAQIAANSSDPLNLKAHRNAFAQSLLFKPAVAAQQSVDALFEICHEGFLELCSLDSRFQPFARSIFGEQSKSEDRSQLTSAQNNELDHVLESFLSLLGSRILLKPALKALEWLIRHFRVHEMNTACVLYTFLPYHTMPHFTTLLSILPRKLPHNFQFLMPYQSQSISPPREEIVYAATRNANFWREWTVHVLETCRKDHQYHQLIAFWASIATASLDGQIKNASKGNRAFEQQKTQDIVLNTLPLINEALSMTSIADMRISALLLLTVLVSKTTLADQTLGKTMEAVVEGAVKDTQDAELICLVVLAQKRSSTKLPRKIIKYLCNIPTIADDLVTLGEQYDVGTIATGLIQGVAQNKAKVMSFVRPDFVEKVAGGRLLNEEQKQLMFGALLQAAQIPSEETTQQVREWVIDGLRKLSESEACRESFRRSLRGVQTEIPHLETLLQTSLRLENSDVPMLEGTDITTEDKDEKPSLEVLLDRMPSRTVSEKTFLAHSESHLFPILVEAFRLCIESKQAQLRFMSLPIFQNDEGRNPSLLCSFLLRVMGEAKSPHIQASSLSCLVTYVTAAVVEDAFILQALLPYVLHALSDAEDSVRSAAVALGAAIQATQTSWHQKQSGSKAFDPKVHTLYGDETDAKIAWLSNGDAEVLIKEVLMPNLEECRADATYATQVLRRCLGSDHPSDGGRGETSSLKLSQRENIFKFLLDHIAQTPILAVKIRLLAILNTVAKIGHSTKFKRVASLIEPPEQLKDDRLADLVAKQSIKPVEYGNAVATMFDPRDKASLKALEEILKTSSAGNSDALLTLSLKRLGEIWNRLKRDAMTSFAKLLFDRAISHQGSFTDKQGKNAFLELLRLIPLPLMAITEILEKLPKQTSFPTPEKPTSKRRRLSQGSLPIQAESDMVETRRAIAIALELVEGSSEGSHPSLIPMYFDLLASLHHVKDPDTGITYMQTLLMDLLNKAVGEASRISALLDRPSLRIELVVDCFRHSTNTQLQQASLLLMSSLAAIAPDEVMNSIMPVFTFMGSTILQQSDDYSVHVINKTIESVIPQLLASLQRNKRDTLSGVSELMLSFVAAFEHIAPHRRHDVFATLVDKIDPCSYLFVFPVMLVDKQGCGKETTAFAINIAAGYPCNVQVDAIHSCFDLMSDGLQRKSTIAKYLYSTERFPEYQTAAAATSQLMDRWLCSPQLTTSISKVLKKDGEDAASMHRMFAKLMRQTLHLMNQSAASKVMAARSQVLLKRVIGLFPLEHSIKALDELLQVGDDSLKLQVLKSLESQVAIQNAGNENARDACTDFLVRLQSILADAPVQDLKKISLSCIDRIIEKFGKSKPQAIPAVIGNLAGPNGLLSDDSQLRSMALLCLTTIVEATEELFVPYIPATLPACLNMLEREVSGQQSDKSTTSSGWAFTSSLLLFVPYIVTGEYLDQILQIVFMDAQVARGSPKKKAVSNVVALIPSQIAGKECFSALERTWDVAQICGPEAVKLYISIFDLAIEKLSKIDAAKQSNMMTTIWLMILDLRRSQTNTSLYNETDVVDIEQHLNVTMIKMIYKLNDKYFRPIFARLIEWANEEAVGNGSANMIARQSSLFSFLSHFFQTLKSIVTGYSAFVVDGAVNVLQSLEDSSAGSMLLWKRVMSTLSASFEHDQDDFWQSPARFGSISPSLIRQIEWATDKGVESDVISCITLLATASDSPDSRKYINSELLGYFRHNAAMVRLAAVKCERSLTDSLGEEWLGMLPEMLPFISEALEDDDEAVEMETRRWIRKVEEILGESLEPMLQ